MRGICEHMRGVGIDNNNIEEKQTSKKHTYFKNYLLLVKTYTNYYYLAYVHVDIIAGWMIA